MWRQDLRIRFSLLRAFLETLAPAPLHLAQGKGKTMPKRMCASEGLLIGRLLKQRTNRGTDESHKGNTRLLPLIRLDGRPTVVLEAKENRSKAWVTSRKKMLSLLSALSFVRAAGFTTDGRHFDASFPAFKFSHSPRFLEKSELGSIDVESRDAKLRWSTAVQKIFRSCQDHAISESTQRPSPFERGYPSLRYTHGRSGFGQWVAQTPTNPEEGPDRRRRRPIAFWLHPAATFRACTDPRWVAPLHPEALIQASNERCPSQARASTGGFGERQLRNRHLVSSALVDNVATRFFGRYLMISSLCSPNPRQCLPVNFRATIRILKNLRRQANCGVWV